jgi:hypothetical protein
VRVVSVIAVVVLLMGIALAVYGETYHHLADPGCDNYPAYAAQQSSLDIPENALYLSTAAMLAACGISLAAVFRGALSSAGGRALMWVSLVLPVSLLGVFYVGFLALTYRLDASSNCF